MQLNSYGTRFYIALETHKKKFLYLPLAAYWLLIFVLTSIPGNSLPRLIMGISDKAKHFGAYLVLSFLLNFALHFQTKFKILNKYFSVYTLAIISFYGILDEIHQIFIPGRYFEWYDFLADFLGGLIGVFISQWVINQNEKNRL